MKDILSLQNPFTEDRGSACENGLVCWEGVSVGGAEGHVTEFPVLLFVPEVKGERVLLKLLSNLWKRGGKSCLCIYGDPYKCIAFLQYIKTRL
jgi:hypothetical protein